MIFHADRKNWDSSDLCNWLILRCDHGDTRRTKRKERRDREKDKSVYNTKCGRGSLLPSELFEVYFIVL